MLLLVQVEVLTAILKTCENSVLGSYIQSKFGSSFVGGPLVPLCVRVCSRIFHLFKEKKCG